MTGNIYCYLDEEEVVIVEQEQGTHQIADAGESVMVSQYSLNSNCILHHSSSTNSTEGGRRCLCQPWRGWKKG